MRNLRICGQEMEDAQRQKDQEKAGAKAGAVVAKKKPAAKVHKVDMIFKQYSSTSCWYRVSMVCHTKNPVRSMGGYLGGMRVVDAQDKQRWPMFMPKALIL
jgi:hypothetical protein